MRPSALLVWEMRGSMRIRSWMLRPAEGSAEISLARAHAAQGDAAALLRLRGGSHYDGNDIEQRKASWLAHAYAAERDCRARPAQARAELEAVLAQIQLRLPEGGALPREIAQIRAGCGKQP